jgi:hypothetical protein
MAAEGTEHMMNLLAGGEADVAGIGLTPVARDPGHVGRSQRIELGEDELALELPPGIQHRLGDRPGLQHPTERVDDAMMKDDTTVGIGLAHLL